MILVVMCVMSVNAQVVIRNNGSSVTISFNMVQYYDIPSEDIPYAQYLRPRTFLLTEVARLIPERFRYNAQYYSPMEAGQEMALELAKFKRLKASIAQLKRGNKAQVSDTVSRQQVKEDAHKAAQQYAAKRAANGQTQQATPAPRQDSTQNTNTQGTSGFATGW